jgi:hypothetical protein
VPKLQQQGVITIAGRRLLRIAGESQQTEGLEKHGRRKEGCRGEVASVADEAGYWSRPLFPSGGCGPPGDRQVRIRISRWTADPSC